MAARGWRIVVGWEWPTRPLGRRRSDHAEVVGGPQPPLAEGLEDAKGLRVIAGHDRAGRLGQREQLAGLPPPALRR